MSTDRVWVALAPSGPAAQKDLQLRQVLREAGLTVADYYSADATHGVLDPSAHKVAWFQAGHLLGRGGGLVVIKRNGRTRRIEDLGGKSCENLSQFLVRVREGMV